MLKKLAVTFISIAPPMIALPPQVPSAGIIEKEIQQEYEGVPLEPTKEAPLFEIDIPEEKLTFPHDKKAFIQKVIVEGNQSIGCEEICGWLEPNLNKDESIQDIYDLCQVIATHYAKKGYFLARAYPPPQTLQDGILKIAVLEGKIGRIQVVGNCFYSSAFILSYFNRLQGGAIQYDQFLRALLLVNENSDLKVGALFEKGEKVGTADIILRASDHRPVHLFLNENNYGRKLTTHTQFGGRLDNGSNFVYGDKLSVAEVVGFPIEALYFTDIIYTAPLTHMGTSLEIAYLFSKFHVMELTSLHLRGNSSVATLQITQAILRKRLTSLDGFVSFNYKQFQNYFLSERTSTDKLRPIGLGVTFDTYAISHGRDYLTAQVAAGIPRFLGGLKARTNIGSRYGSGGRYVKFNLDYDHLHQFYSDYMVTFHTSGQWSPGKLEIPEQIYIGGGSTVRGFPLASALGDSGYYTNLEFHMPLPFLKEHRFFKKKWKEWIQVVGFIDNGGVFLQGAQDVIEWGTGFGIRVSGPWKLALSLDVGFPLNHHDLSTGAFAYLKITGQPF